MSCVLSEIAPIPIYTLSRFVDRDMFMRFLGAGIGHKATNRYTAALRNDALAMANVMQPSTGTVFEDLRLGVPIPDGADALLEEEQDYGYELGSDSESEDDEGLDEEDGDLGAEDGEEPWDVDDLHALGYDEL